VICRVNDQALILGIGVRILGISGFAHDTGISYDCPFERQKSCEKKWINVVTLQWIFHELPTMRRGKWHVG
jgi:hypothetical protein